MFVRGFVRTSELPSVPVYSTLKLSWTRWPQFPRFLVECINPKRKLEGPELSFVFHEFSKVNLASLFKCLIMIIRRVN